MSYRCPRRTAVRRGVRISVMENAELTATEGCSLSGSGEGSVRVARFLPGAWRSLRQYMEGRPRPSGIEVPAGVVANAVGRAGFVRRRRVGFVRAHQRRGRLPLVARATSGTCETAARAIKSTRCGGVGFVRRTGSLGWPGQLVVRVAERREARKSTPEHFLRSGRVRSAPARRVRSAPRSEPQPRDPIVGVITLAFELFRISRLTLKSAENFSPELPKYLGFSRHLDDT